MHSHSFTHFSLVPNSRPFRLAVLILLLSLLAVQISLADDEDWLEKQIHQQRLEQYGKMLGQQLGDVINEMAEARQVRADFNDRIAAARKQYWAAYPDKPGFAEARADFEKLLNEKDLYFLQFDIVRKNTESTSRKLGVGDAFSGYNSSLGVRMLNGADAALGKVDNGLLDAAIPSYVQWLDAVEKPLDAANEHQWDSLSALGNFWATQKDLVARAMSNAEPQHQIYIESRNWSEAYAAGVEPAGTGNPYYYMTAALAQAEGLPWAEAETYLIGMTRLFGTNAIAQAALKVHAAPKDHNGNLSDARAFGLWPAEYVSDHKYPPNTRPRVPDGYIFIKDNKPATVVLGLCEKDNLKNYVLEMLASGPQHRQYPGQRWKTWDWNSAAKDYPTWIMGFGEPAVLKAAAQLRDAPKSVFVGELSDPKSIGAHRSKPFFAFQDLLAANDPQGSVRMLLICNKNLPDRAAADAEYQKLVTKYGEPAVLDAAKKYIGKNGDDTYYGPELDSAEDFNLLIGVLNGKLVITPPKTYSSFPNPDYLGWEKLPIGAMLTTVSQDWILRDGHALASVPYSKITFSTLKLVKKNTTSLDLSEVELIKNTQFTNPSTRIGLDRIVENHSPRYDSKVNATGPVESPILAKFREQLQQAAGAYVPIKETTDTGSETLDVLDQKLTCNFERHIFASGMYTIWTSDQVPGGVALETLVQSLPPAAGSSASGGVSVFAKAAIPTIEKLDYKIPLPTFTFPARVGAYPRETSTPAATSTVAQTTPNQTSSHNPGTPPSATPASQSYSGNIPSGTMLEMRLLEPLTLKDVYAGRRFRAQVIMPVQSGGQVTCPAGAEVFLLASGREMANRRGWVQVVVVPDYLVLNGRQIKLQGQSKPIMLTPDTGGTLREGRTLVVRIGEPRLP